MDVYSQNEQRAHGTGFVGIEAESNDAIDNLEVYEALINPREADQKGGQGGSGMMPPMMGGMGAGGGAGGAVPGGLASSATASSAAMSTAARVTPLSMPGTAPAAAAAGPAAASAGIGSGSLGSGSGMGAAGLGMGAAGAGLAAAPAAASPGESTEASDLIATTPVGPDTAPPPPDDSQAAEQPKDSGGAASVQPSSPQTGQPDVVRVDPAEVDRVAKEWSGLANEMADIGSIAEELQASLEDFGMVKQPAGPYGQMTSGIRQLAGGASKEFDEIASGLSHGAQAYREQEAAAATSVRTTQ